MARHPWTLIAAAFLSCSLGLACAADGTSDDGGDVTTTSGPAPTSGDGGADTEAGDPDGGTGRVESGDEPVGTGPETGGGPEPSP